MVGLTEFSFKKMCELLFGPQKSGRNEGVVALTVTWFGSVEKQQTKTWNSLNVIDCITMKIGANLSSSEALHYVIPLQNKKKIIIKIK